MIHDHDEQLRDSASDQEVQFDRYLNVPWVESPFFEMELAQRKELDDKQKSLLRHFNRFGFITIDQVIADELADQVKRETDGLFNADIVEGYASYYRIHDAWRTSAAVKEIALNQKILATLRLLYGREPVPFQTLNFRFGSQQRAHADSILFNTLPPRYMCGVWVALEDVDHDNGPLFYYPGSQKLPQYHTEDFAHIGNPDDFINERFHHFVRQLIAAHQFSPQEFHVKQGGALIWASNLVHGGMPRLDKQRTRWSQVTHYYFQDCIYYVPLYSDSIAGEYFLRDVTDFRTNTLVPHSFNGSPFHKTPVGGLRYRISFAPEPQQVSLDSSPSLDFPDAGKQQVSRITDRSVLPATESADLVLHFDAFDEKDTSFSILGWAFLRGADLQQPSATQVILQSDHESYVLNCRRVPRPDVAIAHRLAGPNVGFQISLEKRDLSPGKYRIGVLINSEQERRALRFTDRTVDVP